MVTVVPPEANPFSDLGKGLGAGLQEALADQAQYGRKQSRIDKILKEVDSPDFAKKSLASQYATLGKLATVDPSLAQFAAKSAGLLENQFKNQAQEESLRAQSGLGNPQAPQSLSQSLYGGQGLQGSPEQQQKQGFQLQGTPQQRPQNLQRNEQQFPQRTQPHQVLQDQQAIHPQRTVPGQSQPQRRHQDVTNDALRAYSQLSPEAKRQTSPQEFIDREFHREQYQQQQAQAQRAEVQNELAFEQQLQNRLKPGLLKKFPGQISANEDAVLSDIIEKASKTPGLSLAQVEAKVSKDTDTFVSELSRVRNQRSRPDWLSNINKQLTSNDNSTYDQGILQLKNSLKPYRERGLYDLARQDASSLGYRPVEVELAVDEPDPVREALVSQLKPYNNNFGGRGSALEASARGPYQHNQFELINLPRAQQDLQTIFNADPDVNLILLREDLRKKGLDWREFAIALNTLENDGKIKFNDTQRKALQNIDKPPETLLNSFMRSIGLGGR